LASLSFPTRRSSDLFSESWYEGGDTLNNSTRNSTNVSDNKSVISTLLWKHKFKKVSRTLSVNMDINWSETKNDGLLYAINNYFSGGMVANRDTIDQQNLYTTGNKSINTRIAYTEPLMKDTYLEFSYALAYYN